MANETKFPNGVDLMDQDLLNRGNPEVMVNGNRAELDFIPQPSGRYRARVTLT